MNNKKLSEALEVLRRAGITVVTESTKQRTKEYTITIGDQIGFDTDGADEDFESSMEAKFGKDFEIEGISFKYDYMEHDNEDIYLVWKATGNKRDVNRAAKRLFNKIKPVWERERDSYELWERNEIYLDVSSEDDDYNTYKKTAAKVTGATVEVLMERSDLDEDKINSLFDRIRGRRVTFSDSSLNERMIVIPREIVSDSIIFGKFYYPAMFKIKCSVNIPEKLIDGPSGLYLSDKFYSTSIKNIFDDFAEEYFRRAFGDDELNIRCEFDHTDY